MAIVIVAQQSSALWPDPAADVPNDHLRCNILQCVTSFPEAHCACAKGKSAHVRARTNITYVNVKHRGIVYHGVYAYVRMQYLYAHVRTLAGFFFHIIYTQTSQKEGVTQLRRQKNVYTEGTQKIMNGKSVYTFTSATTNSSGGAGTLEACPLAERAPRIHCMDARRREKHSLHLELVDQISLEQQLNSTSLVLVFEPSSVLAFI